MLRVKIIVRVTVLDGKSEASTRRVPNKARPFSCNRFSSSTFTLNSPCDTSTFGPTVADSFCGWNGSSLTL